MFVSVVLPPNGGSKKGLGLDELQVRPDHLHKRSAGDNYLYILLFDHAVSINSHGKSTERDTRQTPEFDHRRFSHLTRCHFVVSFSGRRV